MEPIRLRPRVEPGHPDLISIPCAAKLLGISADTGYTLARRGDLPGALQIGGKWLVSRPRLEKHYGIGVYADELASAAN